MPQSLSRVLLHMVFSTKDRQPFISPDLRGKLHAYLIGVLRNLDCPSIQVGGSDDHMHLLMVLSRTMTIAGLAEEVKTSSSKWAKTQGVPAFAWQTGYGVFSVSESRADDVVAYIQGQEEHHRHRTFQEEFREFLQRHQVPFDERYVWA